MLSYLLAISVGSISGIVWEYLGTKSFSEYKTLAPSVFVKIGGKSVHLHHWLSYLLAIIVILVISYKYDRLLHPSVIMMVTFFVSAILYNFKIYPDEWVFFAK